MGERKGRAHFCLVPGGTSPWTNQLYESFFCGCIPVILSDEYEVAFQHILKWPTFSIKWPESAVSELYDFLHAFDGARLREMKAAVDATSCWFDYYSESADCSPYLGVLSALEERRQRLHALPWRRFWNGGETVGSAPKRTTRFHSHADETFML